MSSTHPSQELSAALDAARAAADVIRGFYQRNVKIEIKADKTPVTEADVRALMDEAIRRVWDTKGVRLEPEIKLVGDWSAA